MCCFCWVWMCLVLLYMWWSVWLFNCVLVLLMSLKRRSASSWSLDVGVYDGMFWFVLFGWYFSVNVWYVFLIFVCVVLFFSLFKLRIWYMLICEFVCVVLVVLSFWRWFVVIVRVFLCFWVVVNKLYCVFLVILMYECKFWIVLF